MIVYGCFHLKRTMSENYVRNNNTMITRTRNLYNMRLNCSLSNSKYYGEQI